MSLSELLVSGATMLRRTVCRAAGLSVVARMASRTQGAGAAAAFVAGGDVAARASHTLRSDRKPTRAELLEAIHNSQLAMDKTYTTDLILELERLFPEKYSVADSLRVAKLWILCGQTERAMAYLTNIPETSRNGVYFATLCMLHLHAGNAQAALAAINEMRAMPLRHRPKWEPYTMAWALRAAKEAGDEAHLAKLQEALAQKGWTKLPVVSVSFEEMRAGRVIPPPAPHVSAVREAEATA